MKEVLLTLLLLLLLTFVLCWLYLALQPSPTITTTPGRTVVYNSIGRRGQMGNQMFEVAATVAAARANACACAFPKLLSQMPLYRLCDLSSLHLQDLAPTAEIRETSNWEPIILPPVPGVYNVRGFRQSWRYFSQDKDTTAYIRQLFQPRASHLEVCRKKVGEKPYIAMHIRRGDYAHQPSSLWRGLNSCSLQYFQKGARLLHTKYPSLPLYICSDDPAWVKEHLSEIDEAAQVQETNSAYIDFCLLLQAQGVVIANSSYSWWAAWLGEREGRTVIAPTPWWYPYGLAGRLYRLDNDHLNCPTWLCLDAQTGEERTVSNSTDDSISLYRLLRGAVM